MKDEKRRCFGCGAVDHVSPNCPRNAKKDGSKAKVMKDDEETMSSTSSPKKRVESAEDSTVKLLLEDANNMLKSLTKDENSGVGSDSLKKGTLPALQLQVAELKQKTMKLSQLNEGTSFGLIDSGATHPLRPLREGERKTTGRWL